MIPNPFQLHRYSIATTPARLTLVALAILLAGPALSDEAATTNGTPADNQPTLGTLVEQRQRFQNQPLTTSDPLGFIFNPDTTPRIIWRDADLVRALGGTAELTVRWFDAELSEVDAPNGPGRWGAYVQGTAPNGTVVRRGLTFYCRPPGFLLIFPAEEPLPLPQVPAPIDGKVWEEHTDEVQQLGRDRFLRALNNDESAAILLAGLAGAEPQGRPARPTEAAAVQHDDYHLALKLKILGRSDEAQPLPPPRKLGQPAPMLRAGASADAGVKPGTKARLDELCAAWAADSDEPFVTLVARHGVIVTHVASGVDDVGEPVGLDYRCPVFSITKTVTGLLFGRFLDQGLVGLDDPISTVLPDYPEDSPHVPTFRQCLTFTSGLSGHGSWGGVRHPYLDNLVLNGIDVNQPGEQYAYSGMGYDLTVEALELITGQSAVRLYQQHLFRPLGLGEVPISEASAGAKLTAHELGALAQLIANQGRYGDQELIAPATFDRLLPKPLKQWYPKIEEVEGIGLHFKNDRRPGAPPRSNEPEDLLFSDHTVGYGSLSQCLLRVDLERDLIVVQVRKEAGERHGEWLRKFLAAVRDGLILAPDVAGEASTRAAGR
jgi:CubicO group peptidase (beta-lactamase class C family)